MSLLTIDIPSETTFASTLPHCAIDQWQAKYKQNKETLFYCGWAFKGNSMLLISAWEPNLRALLGNNK